MYRLVNRGQPHDGATSLEQRAFKSELLRPSLLRLASHVCFGPKRACADQHAVRAEIFTSGLFLPNNGTLRATRMPCARDFTLHDVLSYADRKIDFGGIPTPSSDSGRRGAIRAAELRSACASRRDAAHVARRLVLHVLTLLALEEPLSDVRFRCHRPN